MPTRTTIPGQPPHVCSFTLRGTDPEGFFTGETLAGWDPRAFITISYVRQLARELGYVHPDEARALVSEVREERDRADRLQREVDRLQADADAVDGLVRNREYVVRKRVGRPPETREKV